MKKQTKTKKKQLSGDPYTAVAVLKENFYFLKEPEYEAMYWATSPNKGNDAQFDLKIISHLQPQGMNEKQYRKQLPVKLDKTVV